MPGSSLPTSSHAMPLVVPASPLPMSTQPGSSLVITSTCATTPLAMSSDVLHRPSLSVHATSLPISTHAFPGPSLAITSTCTISSSSALNSLPGPSHAPESPIVVGSSSDEDESETTLYEIFSNFSRRAVDLVVRLCRGKNKAMTFFLDKKVSTKSLLQLFCSAKMKTRVLRITVDPSNLLADVLKLHKRPDFDIYLPLEVTYTGKYEYFGLILFYQSCSVMLDRSRCL